MRARTPSDAATDATVLPVRPALRFRVPEGPLALFAVPPERSEPAIVITQEGVDGAVQDLKRDAAHALEVLLDGARLRVGAGSARGEWAKSGAGVLESTGRVRAGVLEVLGAAF